MPFPPSEIGTIVLIGVLVTLGIIAIVLVLLAAGYFWWRHKRSQLEFVEPCDDHETSSASLKFQQLLESQQQEQLLEEQKKQQAAQQTNTQANKINSKLNGFLNLKTPLIGWVLLATSTFPPHFSSIRAFFVLWENFFASSPEWNFFYSNFIKFFFELSCILKKFLFVIIFLQGLNTRNVKIWANLQINW